MATGNYGTIRPADVSVEDVEMWYSFTPSRELVSNVELTSLEQAFRPWLSIKYLIDMIFAQPDVPFTYTSSFLNTAEFSELYMDFNWGTSDSADESEISLVSLKRLSAEKK